MIETSVVAHRRLTDVKSFLLPRLPQDIDPIGTGTGRFGSAFRCSVNTGPSKVDCFGRELDDGPDPTATTKSFMRAVDLLTRLPTHPCILPFKFYQLHHPKAYYMQFSPDPSLADVLSRPSPWFDDTAKSCIIYGVACALAHLHTHDAFHGYVHPKRVQLSADHTPQLTDYAFGHTDLPRDSDAGYSQPGEPASPARDVFQFGVLVWAVLTGRPPPSPLPLADIAVFPFLARVVKHCVAPAPQQRPTFAQILAAMGRAPALLPDANETQYEHRARQYFKVVFERARPGDRALYERMEREGAAERSGRALVTRGKAAFTAGNVQAALADLKQAVDDGYRPARCWCAIALIAHRKNEGWEMLREAAQEKDPDAMYELGSLLDKQGNAEGIAWLEKAAEAGVVEAICHMARHYETIELFEKARDTYRRAADMGNESALIDYARMLTDPKFGEVEGDEAIRRLEQAVAKGSAEAMYTLATCWRDGRGCDKNMENAVANYERAAELRYIPACVRLAFLYMPNERAAPIGVAPNVRRAIELYEIAVAAGDFQAMHNYAVILSGQMGRGQVPMDVTRAVALWKRAAEEGKLAASQFRYGECAEKGTEMPKDRETASRYYALAAAQGNPKATEALSRLNRQSKQ